MDLDSEKEKARYSFKLEIIKVVTDKLLLGLVLGLIGFAFNLALENYKTIQIERQFYLEKKLAAINTINEAYQRVITSYSMIILPDNDKAKPLLEASNEQESEYYKSVISLANTASRNGILLSKKFSKLAQIQILIFEGIYYKDRAKRGDYFNFILHLTDMFTNHLIVEMGQPSELDDNMIIEFDKPNMDILRTKGAIYFLDICFIKWKCFEMQKK